MHVIARPRLEQARRDHPDASSWLNAWWVVATHAEWHSLEEVRSSYASADQVECCLVFDVRGNRYRLICRVSYANRWQRGTLLIKHFLTHTEYDKDKWKKDCQ